MRIADESQAEDPELINAIMAFHSPKRSIDELVLWCETTQQVNQKMLCGLLRSILKAPPSKSMQNVNLAIAVMLKAKRLALDATYKVEMNAMAAHWDAACCKSLASFKGRAGQERHGGLRTRLGLP